MSKTSKTRFAFKLDKLFWFFIMILPLIAWGIHCYGRSRGVSDIRYTYESDNITEIRIVSDEPYSLRAFMDNCGFSSASDNVIYTSLEELFGNNGHLPLFAQSSDSIISYIVYVVNIELIHIAFDVIVFIPRLCHKWVGKAVQDD